MLTSLFSEGNDISSHKEIEEEVRLPRGFPLQFPEQFPQQPGFLIRFLSGPGRAAEGINLSAPKKVMRTTDFLIHLLVQGKLTSSARFMPR